MLPELAGKRSAEVVRPAATAVIPRPMGYEILRGQTQKEVLKKVKRGVKRGEFGSVSALARVSAQNGGGWAVKAIRVKPAPEPIPLWCRVLIRCGLVLMGLALALAALAAALSALVGSLLALPWLAMAGAAGVVFLLMLATGAGRSVVRVIVDVTVRH